MHQLGRADDHWRARLATRLGGVALLGGLLTAACAPAAGPAGGATSAPAPLALRIAYATPEAGMTPLWLAQDHGHLREYGVDAELVFLSSGRTDQGVIAGETPVGFGANVITSRLGGADIVAVAGVV